MIQSLELALDAISDGTVLAVPREQSGVAMAATRALIRRGVARLHLVALPTSTLQADLLIGAGAVAILETSAVSLGEHGPAPRFTAAIKAGTIIMKDATCPAIYAALQAAEKGIPFMPLRGLIGSDLLAHRPEWRVIDNPFGNDDPVVLLPAIKPDVALFHAPMADGAGRCVDRPPARFCRRSRTPPSGPSSRSSGRHDGNLLDDPVLRRRHFCRASTSKQWRSPRAAPGRCRCPITIQPTRAHLPEYAKMAATAAGFRRIWVNRTSGGKRAA